jgi:hypothetical protein
MNTLLSSVRLVKQVARLKGLWLKFVLSVGIMIALGIPVILYTEINVDNFFPFLSNFFSEPDERKPTQA